MVKVKATKNRLKPLAITCTSADCKSGLHCFRRTKKMEKKNLAGKCRVCRAELIDWNRVHKKDLADVTHTFEALKKELLRHHFFHVDIDEKAVNHARRKGRIGIHKAVIKRLIKSVGAVKPYRDGYQTPYKGNIIYYAQHATASCCRKCMEYWHRIPQGRALTEEEIEYFAELLMLFINDRLPILTEFGEKVPPLRRR